MRKMLYGVALLLLIAIHSGTYAARPNIILCMADDQGWGDTGYNGHPRIKTPHLDAMSRSGLRFDRFYAAAPVCSPTRGSVLTGRHPNRFGCFSWGLNLRPQEITIAERLQASGYATGHFGKWHLGSVLKGSPVNPAANGFDEWLSAFNFYDNDPVLSHKGVATEVTGESSHVAARAAIDFIREQARQSKPFFAVVWFGSPHSPHRAAAEDKVHYEGEKDAEWMGEITGLDRAVGSIRSALRELEIARDTLFWYTSDNGGLRKESSGGRGKKGSIYEGGLRVPAIIEWPARIPSARVTNVPANTSDIFPTLLEVVGESPDKKRPLDGVSLVGVIDGKTETRERSMGFWSFGGRGIGTPSDQWMREELAAQQSGKTYHDRQRLRLDAAEIREQYPVTPLRGHLAWLRWPYKLHYIVAKKRKQDEQPPTPRLELYNLEKDPSESHDLAVDNATLRDELREELFEWAGSVIGSLNGDDYP